MCVSGADEKMKKNPDTYKKLLLSQQDQSLMDTIDLGKPIMTLQIV